MSEINAICVYCGSRPGTDPAFVEAARGLGKILAENAVRLVYGGGSVGLMGALASQFWFLAFALATAASVRTLALIEVLFAQLVARFAFGQKTTLREAIGMVLVVAGVVLLIFEY